MREQQQADRQTARSYRFFRMSALDIKTSNNFAPNNANGSSNFDPKQSGFNPAARTDIGRGHGGRRA
jgi:hypothetical protein